MKQYDINGLIIEVEKKKIKNMYLRILPPEGKVHISAPHRISETEIQRFVLSKLDWIKVQQSKIRLRNYEPEPEFMKGEKVSVWGNRLLIITEQGKRNFAKIEEGKLILTMKEGCTLQQRKKAVYDWYRNALMQEIPGYINRWEKIIGVHASGFIIRDMKTRWGTCNIRSKKICLNLQLAKKPTRCLEYVVVHELVHLLEKSHNHVFKAYMDKFLPSWQVIKKELNSGNS
jgi:predicted metal-dependent hydrolase